MLVYLQFCVNSAIILQFYGYPFVKVSIFVNEILNVGLISYVVSAFVLLQI